MLVKALEFAGCCMTCSQGNDTPGRGGVEVALSRDSDDMGEMICLKCAKRLADRLVKAIAECKERQSAGQEYRHDKWSGPAKAPTKGPQESLKLRA